MTAQQFMHPLQHTKHTYQYISLNLILWEIYFHSIHNEVIHVDSIFYRLNQTQFTISACRMCRAGQKIFPSLQDDGTRFCRNQPIRLLVSAVSASQQYFSLTKSQQISTSRAQPRNQPAGLYYQCTCMHFIPSHYHVPKRRIRSPASPSCSKKAPPVTSPLPLTTVCCRTDRQRFLDKSS